MSTAGEVLLDSLRRLAQVGTGEFTIELRGVVLAVGTGSRLGEALRQTAVRLDLPCLTRAVDEVIAAGAPLADEIRGVRV